MNELYLSVPHFEQTLDLAQQIINDAAVRLGFHDVVSEYRILMEQDDEKPKQKDLQGEFPKSAVTAAFQRRISGGVLEHQREGGWS